MQLSDEVDGGGKLVEKSSKSWKIVKKSKKPQKSEKFAKIIDSKGRLPKYRSSVKELKFHYNFDSFLSSFLLDLGALSIPSLERLLLKQSW